MCILYTKNIDQFSENQIAKTLIWPISQALPMNLMKNNKQFFIHFYKMEQSETKKKQRGKNNGKHTALMTPI